MPLGCGGPRARPRFRQVSSIVRRELTKPRGGRPTWRPTTRDPGQDLQSLPLLYATHMTLHAEHVRMSCYDCLLRVLSAGAAEGEASRREGRDGWTPNVRSVCFASCLKSKEDPKTDLQERLRLQETFRPAGAPARRAYLPNSALSPPPLAFHLPTFYNRVNALT